MNINKNGQFTEEIFIERTLPEGYTQLEYIQSTGDQYINTNFCATGETRVKIEYEIISYSAWDHVFGACGGASGTNKFFLLEINENNKYLFYFSNLVWIKDPIKGKHILDWNKNVINYNNQETAYGNYTAFTADYPIHIFGCSNYTNGHNKSPNMKLYSCKIYNKGILIRDYIPAKRNSDNILGLYDLVHKQFYINAGTGDFIVGPIIGMSSANVKIVKSLGYNNVLKIRTESDGSKWLQIFHHDKPSSHLFSSTNDFVNGFYIDSYRWFYMNLCNKFKKWEFLLIESSTSTSEEYKSRWKQNINPMAATFSDTAVGQIYVNNNHAYLVRNDSQEGDWWGAIGAWDSFQGGIPGYAVGVITDGFMDIYIRIDNDSISEDILNKTLIKQEYIEVNNLIEI